MRLAPLAIAAVVVTLIVVAGAWPTTEASSASGDVPAAAGASCPPSGNDDFEAGTVDSDIIPCWTVELQQDSALNWCNQAGTSPPDNGACQSPSITVDAPPQGSQAAMTGPIGFGNALLYRCGILASSGISFELYIQNTAGSFVWYAGPLDYEVLPNFQVRVDLVKKSAMEADPFTTDANDILIEIYQSPDDIPIGFGGIERPYDTGRISTSASPHIGQNVCLRFATVVGEFAYLGSIATGIDDVTFDTNPKPTPTPCPGPCPTPTITLTPTVTPTPTPTTPAPSVNASIGVQGQACNTETGPVVCTVGSLELFTVEVRVESFSNLPDDDSDTVAGYIAAKPRLNYAGVNVSIPPRMDGVWPDCVDEQFGIIPGILQIFCQTATSAPFPESTHTGPIAEFDFSCITEGTATISMPHTGDQPMWIRDETSTEIYDSDPSPEKLIVNCVVLPTSTPTATPTTTETPTPTTTKLPSPGDTDGDGCSDVQENGPSETAGGLRNHKNFWDFYDIETENGAAAGTHLQGAIGLADIFEVAGRFGQMGDPEIDPLSDASGAGYHTRYDRGPQIGANVWNRGPADGAIALSDVFAIAAQFAHSCL